MLNLLKLTSNISKTVVSVDTDDLELVDLLQDMDEKPVEEDSVMGTPAAAENEEENESDNDLEYSQVFNEDTLVLDPYIKQVSNALFNKIK